MAKNYDVDKHSDDINPNIRNTIYKRQLRLAKTYDDFSKKRKYVSVAKVIKNFKSSQNHFVINRRKDNCTRLSAIELYNRMSKRYFNITKEELDKMTKRDLIKKALAFLTSEQYAFNLTDDSQSFQLYKFIDNGTIEPYLFSIVYPQTLFSVTEDENFKDNFQIVSTLMTAIKIDAFITVINNSATQYIKDIDKTNQLKNSNTTWDWNWDWNALNAKDNNEIWEDLKSVLNVQSPNTYKKIYNIYTPNILAYAFFYCKLHKGKTLKNKENKNPSSFMKQQIFYTGGKRANSVNCLFETYSVFSKNFDSFFDNLYKDETKEGEPTGSDDITSTCFKKLLSLSEFNQKTHLFDINLMNDFPGYKPYIIDGLLTKLVLGKAIEYNRKKLLSMYLDKHPHSRPESRLALTSIENSPDNILSNLEQYDLEFLNFIINRTAATIKNYYEFKPEKQLLDLIKNIELYMDKFKINLNCLSDYVTTTDLLHIPPYIDIENDTLSEILEYVNFSDLLSSVETENRDKKKE